MWRYARLLRVYWRLSLMRAMAYRINFLLRLGIGLVDGGARLFIFLLIFTDLSHYPGWGAGEVLVLVGVAEVMTALFFALFIENLPETVRQVRTGTLDATLLRPVPSQFHCSFFLLNWADALTALVGVAEIAFGLSLLERLPSFGEVAAALLLMPAGLLAGYALWFMISTVAFYTPAGRLHELFLALQDLNKYPREIYRGALRSIFLYVVPVGLMANVPAEALMGRLDPRGAVLLLALSAALLGLSSLFWTYSLRRYHGASS